MGIFPSVAMAIVTETDVHGGDIADALCAGQHQRLVDGFANDGVKGGEYESSFYVAGAQSLQGDGHGAVDRLKI
jgi:hypothetical protein